ncbi:MAG: hypothetical protein ACREBF_01730 [Candidatus Micrarchaeales archaeon]
MRPLSLNVNYNNYNRRFNLNANNRPDNAAEMVPVYTLGLSIGNLMKTYGNLYSKLHSHENLELAYYKARKRKTLKNYVLEFESDL